MFEDMTRRALLRGALGAALSCNWGRLAIGGRSKIRIGLLLSHGGTFAIPGIAVTNGFKLAIAERSGMLGGREVELVMVDDESNPSKAAENTQKLLNRDKVDFLVGPVHSGVAMGMIRVIRDTQTITVIPNAGFNAATRSMCAKHLFRTSFSNWQVNAPMGKVAVDRGYKNVVTLTWKYAAGVEMIDAFTERFTNEGGKVVRALTLPFPSQEFQPHLTEIAAIKPDAVFVFFAGAGAMKFVKDYAAAGLKSIPLLGSGFVTDGVLQEQGDAAEGILTTLHYADALDSTANREFRAKYASAFGKDPDVYAVQGYDAGQLLAAGMDAVRGDAAAKEEMIAGMEAAEIPSPRGVFRLSKSHNPIQDVYLRQVNDGKEIVLGVAEKAVADAGVGCRLI